MRYENRVGLSVPPCRAGRRRCRHQIHRSGPGADPPLLLAEIIDELVPAGDTAAIWRTGGWMSLLALGAVGCNITANRMAAWVSMEMTRVLRQDLYRRIQGLSCTQADQFSPSSLVSRLTNDTYNVHQMFDKVQRGGIRAPMLVLGGLILTFLLEPLWRWCSWR